MTNGPTTPTTAQRPALQPCPRTPRYHAESRSTFLRCFKALEATLEYIEANLGDDGFPEAGDEEGNEPFSFVAAVRSLKAEGAF